MVHAQLAKEKQREAEKAAKQADLAHKKEIADCRCYFSAESDNEFSKF